MNGIASGDPLSAGRNSRVVEGVEFSFTVPDAGWEAFGTTSINKSIVGPQGAEAIIYWTSFPDGDDAHADDAGSMRAGAELVHRPNDRRSGSRGLGGAGDRARRGAFRRRRGGVPGDARRAQGA